jgi:hypothetical protein
MTRVSGLDVNAVVSQRRDRRLPCSCWRLSFALQRMQCSACLSGAVFFVPAAAPQLALPMRQLDPWRSTGNESTYDVFCCGVDRQRVGHSQWQCTAPLAAQRDAVLLRRMLFKLDTNCSTWPCWLCCCFNRCNLHVVRLATGGGTQCCAQVATLMHLHRTCIMLVAVCGVYRVYCWR